MLLVSRVWKILRTILYKVQRKCQSKMCIRDRSKALSQAQVNIANMRLRRQGKGGLAIMVIEVDQKIPQSVITSLRKLEGIRKATYYEREGA